MNLKHEVSIKIHIYWPSQVWPILAKNAFCHTKLAVRAGERRRTRAVNVEKAGNTEDQASWTESNPSRNQTQKNVNMPFVTLALLNSIHWVHWTPRWQLKSSANTVFYCGGDLPWRAAGSSLSVGKKKRNSSLLRAYVKHNFKWSYLKFCISFELKGGVNGKWVVVGKHMMWGRSKSYLVRALSGGMVWLLSWCLGHSYALQ